MLALGCCSKTLEHSRGNFADLYESNLNLDATTIGSEEDIEVGENFNINGPNGHNGHNGPNGQDGHDGHGQGHQNEKENGRTNDPNHNYAGYGPQSGNTSDFGSYNQDRIRDEASLTEAANQRQTYGISSHKTTKFGGNYSISNKSSNSLIDVSPVNNGGSEGSEVRYVDNIVVVEEGRGWRNRLFKGGPEG